MDPSWLVEFHGLSPIFDPMQNKSSQAADGSVTSRQQQQQKPVIYMDKNAMKNMDQQAIEIGISAIHPLQKMEISRFFRP